MEPSSSPLPKLVEDSSSVPSLDPHSSDWQVVLLDMYRLCEQTDAASSPRSPEESVQRTAGAQRKDWQWESPLRTPVCLVGGLGSLGSTDPGPSSLGV